MTLFLLHTVTIILDMGEGKMQQMNSLNDVIKRRYTKDNVDVYDMFSWKRVDVIMTNWKTQEKIVDMPQVEFPEHFSQNACDIIASKYFKQNIPYLKEGKETSFKQLVERMVNFWVSALVDEGMIDESQSVILHDELAYMMCAQMYAPNSPQWFNTGMALAYGIKGEARGHFYYDEKLGKVVESEDEYTRTQGSACFIVSVEDSLLGNKSITHQLEVETRLFKSGSGVGSNWSNIRAEGEPLSGGGKSSGLMSFLNVFNANAGAIKSGGTCLAPHQKVFTEVGAVPVKELAELENGFIALSYDPPAKRYKAKKAKAWLAGHKQVKRIVTDKGSFELTYDHPVKLSTGEFVKVEDLKVGMSLFSGSVNENKEVNLHNEENSKCVWEKLIDKDIHGNIEGYEEVKDSVEQVNHRVVEIIDLGLMDVYDVEVECPTEDDKSVHTGHNFLIWSLDNESDYFGTGIVVANTRRAAKMNVLDINHPDIEQYITWKAKEEQKVRDLGKMGYDTHFDGEAYATVGGQNANNSVRVTDEYMDKLLDNSTFELTRRVDGEVVKEVDPKDLWRLIAQSAWECGDPGLQYDTTINDWHTCPLGEDGKEGAKHNRINASNPCSEYMFLDDTACNLASINLMAFYDKENNVFDVDGYKHCIGLCQLILEATIHWGQFPTAEIARKSYMFRTTGLGYANLGALLMCMGYGYDTEEARQIGSSLLGLLTGQSYVVSALMAKQTEPFKYFDLNSKHMLRVIYNHKCVNNGEVDKCVGLGYTPYSVKADIVEQVGLVGLGEELKEVWENAYNLGQVYGYRNAQVSVLAPTGTISFAMDCSTTSSEPFFGNMVWKKLVGGGGISIVNDCIPYGLKTLGYNQDEIDEILEYIEKHYGLVEGAPHIKEEHLQVFDTANKASGGERYIEPMGHVRMMAALTPQVSGAISKTVNMPNDATVEDIENIYYQSWELGVKAIALYRDGCKASQPLNVVGLNEGEKPLEELSYQELLEKVKAYEEYKREQEESVHRVPGSDETLVRVKPEGIRQARVHAVEIGGIKLYVTVSRYENGNIAEVYVSAGRQGTLVKGLLDSLSTTISEMIQYGINPKDIAKMYRGQKFEPSGFVGGHPYIKMADSISDLISKIIDIELGDYTYCQVKPTMGDIVNHAMDIVSAPSEVKVIKGHVRSEEEQVIYGETCKNCGSDQLVKNGTCKVCRNCGTTTGCS